MFGTGFVVLWYWGFVVSWYRPRFVVGPVCVGPGCVGLVVVGGGEALSDVVAADLDSLAAVESADE